MNTLLEDVLRNFEAVKERVQKAVERSDRKPDDVKIVVVTKSKSVEIIKAAVEAGAYLLGENYPEESEQKIKALREYSQIEWHMIGHLQSRKTDIVAQYFTAIHSIDRIKIAEVLENHLALIGKVMPALLEFNVSGEDSKYGWPAWDKTQWPNLLPDIQKVLCYPHVKVSGLMTMPPLFYDKRLARPFFSRLRELRDFLGSSFPQHDWNELSMGTSVDFEIAIEEGATFVRIGQAILSS